LVPLLFGNFFETLLVLLKSGVVDENVELAKLVDRLLDEPFTDFRIADVAFQGDRALAFSSTPGWSRRRRVFQL
jgi:hypothetical protein